MLRSLLCAVVVSMLQLSVAVAETFEIRAGEDNQVRFESKAPLESFDGRTNRVRGYIALNPHALADSIDVSVEVDLASLETGMALRDQHMRENHLETEKYPKAVFRGGWIDELTADHLQPGETVQFVITGVLDLHGVERSVRVPVEMKSKATAKGMQLRVRARFEVKLSDHDIPRPKFLVMKLNDVQTIELDLIANPSTAIQ